MMALPHVVGLVPKLCAWTLWWVFVGTELVTWDESTGAVTR